MSDADPFWLVVDGYEDEPAAFGVPPYVGFHVRYVCGVLRDHELPYRYLTVDDWRRLNQARDRADPLAAVLPEHPTSDAHCDTLADLSAPDWRDRLLGVVILAGAVVPGKYLRGTPISRNEVERLAADVPPGLPFLLGGWAPRHWRQAGWLPLRRGLFIAVQDLDATLDHLIRTGDTTHQRRDPEQWRRWALLGADSAAIHAHPDTPDPLHVEVEVYQGCVRYANGCMFCIEPKKGLPKWREIEHIVEEVTLALDAGARHVRLGGMTDVYTYRAEGLTDLVHPRPDPEPITELLQSLRDDPRLDLLHVDNANPSIIAEHLPEADAITRTLTEHLSDGAVLSFGLESTDPEVFAANRLNCTPQQAITAIELINRHGRQRGSRGLPRLLPGLNFIAGLHQWHPTRSTALDLEFLGELERRGLWVRRINLRQVEGDGYPEVEAEGFQAFKREVRERHDARLLEEMLPRGTRLGQVWWERHDSRLPGTQGRSGGPETAGVTFGRQLGAYPILVGLPYRVPLERMSDVIVTDHGQRSLTAVEAAMDPNTATEPMLRALPGVGRKSAWALVSHRARALRKRPEVSAFAEVADVGRALGRDLEPVAVEVLAAGLGEAAADR